MAMQLSKLICTNGRNASRWNVLVKVKLSFWMLSICKLNIALAAFGVRFGAIEGEKHELTECAVFAVSAMGALAEKVLI